MINNDRVVPIQKIDYLSMIGTIFALNNTSYSVLTTSSIDGEFNVTGSDAAGTFLANQPVQTLNFPATVTGATVYFVAAYDYAGVQIDGTTITPTGTVIADGITLYKAVLSGGAVTITTITPSAS